MVMIVKEFLETDVDEAFSPLWSRGKTKPFPWLKHHPGTFDLPTKSVGDIKSLVTHLQRKGQTIYPPPSPKMNMPFKNRPFQKEHVALF